MKIYSQAGLTKSFSVAFIFCYLSLRIHDQVHKYSLQSGLCCVVLYRVLTHKVSALSGDFNRHIINCSLFTTPMAIKTCTQTNRNTVYKELEIKNVLQDRQTYRPTRRAICAVKDITSPCVSCLSYDYTVCRSLGNIDLHTKFNHAFLFVAM